MAVVIRFKRGQSTTWESKNLLLGPGEPGFELDTKQLKIGDGTTVWNELPYINDNERLQTIEEALENVYTKSDIDSKLTALFRYKGSKKSYDQLPEADENQTGDVWNIEDADETHKIKAGDNVAWNGNEWDVLSGVFDLSDYVKKDGNKQLSTEDYTTEDKEKLRGIEDGAQVNAVSSEEFSGLEERVNTLETDAETLAKVDGSNAAGKWNNGSLSSDKVNLTEFDPADKFLPDLLNELKKLEPFSGIYGNITSNALELIGYEEGGEQSVEGNDDYTVIYCTGKDNVGNLIYFGQFNEGVESYNIDFSFVIFYNNNEWYFHKLVVDDDLNGKANAVSGKNTQIVGFDAAGTSLSNKLKAIDSAPQADKLTTPRTINGSEFNGTEDVNTKWAWNKNGILSGNNKTFKIINKPTNASYITNARTNNYLISVGEYGGIYETFILTCNFRGTPHAQIFGDISSKIKFKINTDGIYAETLSAYNEISIVCIGGANSTAYNTIADFSEVIEIPEDLIDIPIKSYNEKLNGITGQVVGFDTNGNAQATEIGGTNLIPNTSTKIATNGWRAYNSPNDVDIIDGYAVSKGFYGNYISLCAPKNKTRIALPAGDYTAYVDAIIENVQEDIRETTKFVLYLLGVDKTISNYSSYILGNFIALDDKPHRYTIHFHTDIELTGTLSMAVLYYHLQNAADVDKYKDITIRIKDFKLERGSVATDWSPAPEDIQEIASGPKYGVSGVGGSNPTLTRLWDAVGLTAAVGTDTQEVTNDFDNLPPFNRRKCVGTWSEPDATGKAHFTVKAYYGDPDYTEDGTMGDYVAVEVEPFYYIQDMENGIWGVSPKYQPGWKIHPVCIDKKTQTVRAKTYLPCYRMAIEKNADTGKGVSLPDLYPVGNSYYQLKTLAHSYSDAAHLEPAEVRNYEELLFTIEFATTNSQSIMAGATSLYVGEAYKCAVAGTSVNYVILTAAQGDNLVVGQNIQITDGSIWGSGLAKDVNKITAIEKCTVDGTVSDSGTYRKVTFDGTARTVTTSTKVTSRPYNTGFCKNVKTPSGSPTNNTNGKYPMRYRWREDIWGDIYSTSNDLFDHLNEQTIEYYYLTEPTWMPSAATKPAFEDFQKDPFVKLEQKCTNTNSFIVKMQGDSVYPYCLVPTNITGGTNATYYCDHAWFNNGTVPDRSLRFGCVVSNGLLAGLFSVGALSAPSHAGWDFGGGLFLEQ